MLKIAGWIALATAMTPGMAFAQKDARALAAGLEDPVWERRFEAAQAIGRLEAAGKPATAALAAALRDTAPFVRVGAAMALGQIGPGAVAAVPDLRKAARTSDLMLTAVAGYALWSVAGDAAAAVDALRLALASPDAKVRGLATASLVEMKGDARGAVASLEKALADPDRAVRANAACAVAQVTGEVARVLPVILAVANDSAAEEFVRVNAIRVLGRMTTAPGLVLPEIIRFLKHEDGDLRWAAAGTLERMGGAAAPALAELERVPNGDPAFLPAQRAIAAIEAARR